jgi:phospho-N-acetylmuramoyl-pentapeptide-transferase
VIEVLIELLQRAGVDAGYFRLLDYTTFRITMAALTALLLELAVGHRFIVWLFRRFRDTGGEHASLRTDSKRGTPTAGGLLLLLSVLTSLILWGRWGNPFLRAAVASLVYFGLIGIFDDWLKMRLKSSLFGLGQMAKTVLQITFAAPFALWLVSGASPLPPSLRTTFLLPYAKNAAWDVGPWLFAGFVLLAFYSIVNAVNVTDGLDGLASGPALLTAVLYGIFAYVLGTAATARHLLFTPIPGVGELAVFSAALAGGLTGFLWFNAYPAEVFMGDTGSMAVGAALASLAFLTRQEMLFPLTGAVFVASMGSTFLQQELGDKHLGRRIFLRAPLHHGWVHRGIAEPKVVIRYWIVSALLTLVAGLSLKLR